MDYLLEHYNSIDSNISFLKYHKELTDFWYILIFCNYVEITEKNNILGHNARSKILTHFSEEVVSNKYENVYNSIINKD